MTAATLNGKWQKFGRTRQGENTETARDIVQIESDALRDTLNAIWLCIKRLPMRTILMIAAVVALLLLLVILHQHTLMAGAGAQTGLAGLLAGIEGAAAGLFGWAGGLLGVVYFAVRISAAFIGNPFMWVMYMTSYLFGDKLEFAMIVFMALGLGWHFGAMTGLALSPIVVFGAKILKKSPSTREAIAQMSGLAVSRARRLFAGRNAQPSPIIRIPVD